MAPFFLYFAYGTDMHPLMLDIRNAGLSVQGPAVLMRHSLRFDIRSAGPDDASAKCDALYTGRASDSIHGVVYQIHQQYRDQLGAARREGSGYSAARATVGLATGPVEALFFTAEPAWREENLLPYDWYVAVIASGARIQGLPAVYQARLRAQRTMRDPDQDRARRNFQIARGSRKIRALFRTPRA